jgi:hypothetical protein
VGALTAYFGFHLDWALPTFVGVLAVGIAAQIWFIASLRRAKEGA